MSVKIISTVWDQSKAEGAALLILLALADHANDDGVCWPSIARLAELARVAERQAQRVITQLEDSGEVYALRRGGRGHSSLYLVTLGHTERSLVKVLTQRFELSEAEARQKTHDILAKRDEKRVSPASPFPPERVTSGAERVTSGAERVTFSALKGDIAMSPEPSLTVNAKPSIEPGEPPAADDGVERETWERAKAQIRLQLPQSTYDTWVRDARISQIDGDAFTIACPSDYAAQWLDLRLRKLISQTLLSILGRPVAVAFVVARPGQGP